MKLSRRATALLAGTTVITTMTVGATVFTAPAQAGAASRLVANVSKLQASAGTCTTFTVTPVDAFGVQSQVPDTVTVTLSESPSDSAHDVDFCIPPNGSADVPSEDPSYVAQDANVTSGQPAPRQSYKAGSTVTDPDTSNGGDPDYADDGTGFSFDPPHSNPTGVDAARYRYIPSRGPIRIGVAGLAAGSATVNVFFDDAGLPTTKNNYKADSSETQTGNIPFTITDGGYPGSATVADAPKSLVIDPADGAGTPGSAQPFTVTLRNQAGDTVRGVTPLIRVGSGGANPNAPASCDQSDNAGVSRCTFTGANPGSDVLTVYVNRVGGTAGPDANEVTATTTRTTTKPAVAASEARYLDLSPRDGGMKAGTNKTFTAAVTDVNGAPAQGVAVTFSETGPGSFAAGTTTVTSTTDATGRATALVSAAASDTGKQTITATITTAGTQCSQQAGFGNGAGATTPAGRCSDTTTNTIAGASPSPSPSASPSTSPSASPTGSPARAALTLSTSTPDIEPNQAGILDVSGQPGGSVELRCYSRPSTAYTTARGPQAMTSGGQFQFQIFPGANTRCYVRYAGDEASASPSVVINVHTTLSLSAVRNGVRNYTFQGRNLPRRPGQLITLYRIDSFGNEIRTANLTTDSSGIYRVNRQFTGVGTFAFRVRTSQTLNNAAGFSRTVTVTVH